MHILHNYIKHWMAQNFLKLNEEKTELILIGSKRQQEKVNLPQLHFGESRIEPTIAVRNLGVIFDTHMSLNSHVQSIVKSAYFHLRNVARVKRYLSYRTTQLLVQSVVTSRLDMCNSLLTGLPSVLLDKLQLVQNNAARVISGTKKHDHITPVLRDLHWLPVRQRIIYKVCLLTFRALHGLAPQYIEELVSLYQPTRALRSQSQHLLVEPTVNLVTFGSRSFSSAAPAMWNQLPLSVKKCETLTLFKAQLKTHLFREAYSV